eukprot:gene27655-36401_t
MAVAVFSRSSMLDFARGWDSGLRRAWSSCMEGSSMLCREERILDPPSSFSYHSTIMILDLPLYDYDHSWEFDVVDKAPQAPPVLSPAILWRQVTRVMMDVFEWHEQRQRRLNLAILAAVVARDKEGALRVRDAAVALEALAIDSEGGNSLSLPVKLASLLHPLPRIDTMLMQQVGNDPLLSNLGRGRVEEVTDRMDFLRIMGVQANAEKDTEGATSLLKFVDVIMMEITSTSLLKFVD